MREKSKDIFEILYCKEGAEQCVHLGSRSAYTRSELESLKLMQISKSVATGAIAVAAGFIAAWSGFVAGGAIAAELAGGAMTIKGAFAGTALGVAIAGGTVSGIDRMNPKKHLSTALMITKFDTDKISVVNDVEKQAAWLHSRLLLID